MHSRCQEAGNVAVTRINGKLIQQTSQKLLTYGFESL